MSDIVFDGMIFDRLRQIGDQSRRIAELAAEIARLRLTDAERETVTEMAEVCDSRERRSTKFQLPEEAEYWRGRASILRGLLAKHKGVEL